MYTISIISIIPIELVLEKLENFDSALCFCHSHHFDGNGGNSGGRVTVQNRKILDSHSWSSSLLDSKDQS